MQKGKERYSKEKVAGYYSQNKEAIKKVKKLIQEFVKRRKGKIIEYQRKRYQQQIQYRKKASQNKWVLFLLRIRMSEKTLNFGNIRVNKKEFHKSKQPINWDLVNVDQIVVSDKFKCSDDGFKYFIGYKEGEILKNEWIHEIL